MNGYDASLAVCLVGLAALKGLTVAALVRRRELPEPSTDALVGVGDRVLPARCPGVHA